MENRVHVEAHPAEAVEQIEGDRDEVRHGVPNRQAPSPAAMRPPYCSSDTCSSQSAIFSCMAS